MRKFAFVAVSGATAIVLYYIRKYYFKRPVWSGNDVKLHGKTVVVTGSNCGIGKAVALDFARRGAKVILACRDIRNARCVANEIMNSTANLEIVAMALDLADLNSIRRFVKELKCKEEKLDILVNNAGVFFLNYSLTKDGVETTFQVNYLGAFYLTLLCLNMLKKSPQAKIINVSSHGHHLCKEIDFDNINLRKSYGKFKSYAQSKAALILFTRILSEKLQDTNVTVNAVNPGNVDTKIFRHFPLLSNPILRAIQWPTRKLIFKSSEDGAQNVIHCAIEPTIFNASGKYFNNFVEEEPSTLTSDPVIAQRLWDQSLKFLGLRVWQMV